MQSIIEKLQSYLTDDVDSVDYGGGLVRITYKSPLFAERLVTGPVAEEGASDVDDMLCNGNGIRISLSKHGHLVLRTEALGVDAHGNLIGGR